MKTSDKILLIFVLFPIVFIIGNLSSESFNIKLTVEKLFKNPVVTNVVKEQTPIKKVVQPISKTISPSSSGGVTNIIKQLSQTAIKKIGESYVLGNMEYKVISAINKGTKYENQTTTGKYIFVKILVNNIGKINSSGSKIIIKDNKDRQFQKEEFFYFAYGSGIKDYNFNMFDNGMAPGFSETYTAAFEVAKDSSDLKLCHPSTTGIDIVCVQLGL